MSRRRQFRLPRVLEMCEPVQHGDLYRHAAKLKPAMTRRELDTHLDNMMRELWGNVAYWEDHGIEPPKEPYPGVEAIRRITST